MPQHSWWVVYDSTILEPSDHESKDTLWSVYKHDRCLHPDASSLLRINPALIEFAIALTCHFDSILGSNMKRTVNEAAAGRAGKSSSLGSGGEKAGSDCNILL
jgi:hypothetical protein